MERGRPGPGLLANILVEKGQDGMPLYRQAQGYKRSGVSLPESTLGDWFGFGCDVMKPIADRESELMVASDYVLGDDTGIKVLDRDHVNGVKRGHMWAFVSGNMVVFRYAPDWTSEHPSEFLRDFSDICRGMAYAGFDKVLEPPEGGPPNVGEERRLGCGMHIRRKFEEAAKLGDARGAIALSFFSKLYRIEAECKKEGLVPEARLARRQAESILIVDDLYRWIMGLHPTVVPGTPIYKAVGYAIIKKRIGVVVLATVGLRSTTGKWSVSYGG